MLDDAGRVIVDAVAVEVFGQAVEARRSPPPETSLSSIWPVKAMARLMPVPVAWIRF